MNENGSTRRVIVVTGASSGMGAATARLLNEHGFTVVAGARRTDRLASLGEGIDGRRLDVTDPKSVDDFAGYVGERYGKVDGLVNSAGLALENKYLGETTDAQWETVFDVNVIGLARITRALLPLLKKAPFADIINVGSVAAFDVYPGGGPYVASKHAVRAITNELRLELNGQPIRVVELGPGMTRTEFADVRFGGDQERVERTYAGTIPLQPEDLAECILFILTRPQHVNIDYMVVRPLDQATSYMLHRRKPAETAKR
ncbi:MAG: SDR family oxidoreductase [Candidatus Eremiobacteraeota bacterium]|nr:SDR family oxidoreductase [Candidatus Eremiobacteraeota bacterium]